MESSPIWEELEDDGARYGCCFMTFLPDEWTCPKEGTSALAVGQFEELRKELPPNSSIQMKGRVVCATHRRYIERDHFHIA